MIRQPWPWYIAGVLIGLTVPALLLLGNKQFGVSSSLRHICAACMPGKIPFFQYDWKKEMWNLLFVTGILIGGFVATQLLSDPNPIHVADATVKDLQQLGVVVDERLMPLSIFNTSNIFTMTGLVFFVIGGFMVGFGTRYASGCTSGHAIMGLSTLQWPSLIATCCFMIGGFTMTNLFLPVIMKWIA